MKRCPTCRRDYYDDSLRYCLEDGVELLQGSVPSPDEPQTALLHDSAPPSEAFTLAQIHTTEKTTALPSVADVPKKGFDKRLIAAPLLALILAAGVYAGYRYFNVANKQIESIAVMPFINGSGNAEVDYLSDGMTETLISSLSRLPKLNVKPRSLVFRYKGKEIDLQTVGKELGVEALVSGRLVPRGDDISLFVELIDVASTKVLWSRQYSRKQSELVVLQSEIARDVSSTLKDGLSGEEEKKVAQTGTDNPEAYRLYLLARSLTEKRKERDTLKAIENYEKAIALDPNYVQAYFGLSMAHQFTAIYGSVPANEALTKARAAHLRAIELSPNSPEARVGLAATELFLERDFAESERELAKALELNPNSAQAHRTNGLRLAFLGRLEEAAAEFRKAIELDPANVTPRINYSWALFYSGRIDESDAELKTAQNIEPSSWFIELQMFINARGRKNHSSAVEHLSRMLDLRDEPQAAKFVRDSFSSGGWKGMMKAVIANPEKAKVWDYYAATFAAELGDKDTAFAFLNKAADKYDQFVLFAKIDPAMEPLRGDPRYSELLKKLGLN